MMPCELNYTGSHFNDPGDIFGFKFRGPVDLGAPPSQTDSRLPFSPSLMYMDKYWVMPYFVLLGLG